MVGIIISIDSKSVQQLLKLWYHESCRVFQDRLVNDDDRVWFDHLLRDQMKSKFNLEYAQVITTNEPVIFCDFLIPNADPKVYAEVTDFKHVKIRSTRIDTDVDV